MTFSSPAFTLTVGPDFVRLVVDGEVFSPVSLTDSEGYLCFTFADGSLFYLQPEVRAACISFDTAGFFPAESLTDRVSDELTRIRVQFGLFDPLPGVVGAEVWSAAVGTVAEAAADEGFMGVKLALGRGTPAEVLMGGM